MVETQRQVYCPRCGHAHTLTAEKYATLQGRQVACKSCGSVFLLALERDDVTSAADALHLMLDVQAPPESVPHYSSPPPMPVASQGQFGPALQPHSPGGYGQPTQQPALYAPAPHQYYTPQAPVQQVVQVINQIGGYVPVRRWSPGAAALLSLFIPGLGQMYKGQVINGLVWFVVVLVGYAALVVPGFVLHVFCILGAASGDPYR